MEDDVQTLIRALKDKKPALYQEWKASGKLEEWAWGRAEEILDEMEIECGLASKRLRERGVQDMELVREMTMVTHQAHEIALAHQIEAIEAL